MNRHSDISINSIVFSPWIHWMRQLIVSNPSVVILHQANVSCTKRQTLEEIRKLRDQRLTKLTPKDLKNFKYVLENQWHPVKVTPSFVFVNQNLKQNYIRNLAIFKASPVECISFERCWVRHLMSNMMNLKVDSWKSIFWRLDFDSEQFSFVYRTQETVL